MINKDEITLLKSALDVLADGFSGLPEFTPEFDVERAAAVIDDAARRMQDNYPYYHPLYAGQMLKPPHPVARVAYALSLWINPNNHALDGGRASSAMEKECVRDLGRMVGWDSPLGHLTGGGTMANLEALWVSGQLRPGHKVLASSQAHYTHSRISSMLGLPFEPVDVDDQGRMSVEHLKTLLEQGEVGTVVATMGTTGFGAVDPLPAILELAREHDVRVHADAAYGGYFGLAGNLDPAVAGAYARLADVDSVVIDPHKHGLQPYGCGSVLFRDPGVGRLYQHGSPYTYFSSAELHLGEISLECSRPGAAAVALWATHQLLPPVRDGDFAAMLGRCLAAARTFCAMVSDGESFAPLLAPELDIVVYAVRAPAASTASKYARAIFDAAADDDLHLALIELPASLVQRCLPDMVADADSMMCLRSVFMKPEHADWIDRIVSKLDAAANKVVRR